MKPISNGRALLVFASSALLCSGWSGANVYTQNFTAPDGTGTNALGDGSILKGNTVFDPTVQGNQLQLTTDIINTNSAFHMPPIAGSSAGWTATFDFTITNGAPNPPGEGFSFSYGVITPNTNSLRPEEGWPARSPVLSFEIDPAVIGDAEVGPAIGLNRPFNIGSVGGSTHSSSLAHTNGDIMADDSTVSGTATISWFPGVGASFTTTGLTTNANFSFIPTPDFTGGDAYAFAIAGRTTSAGSIEVLIDNVVICVGSADSDGDGLPDAWEDANGLDSGSSVGDDGATGDPDGDTLTNLEEFNLDTNPQSNDTDGDGLFDNVENDTGTWGSASATGTDPVNPDSDGDSLLDGVEDNSGAYVDPDNTGTDPNNPNSDGDSKDDGEEVADISRDPTLADDPDPDTVYIQDFEGIPNGSTDLGDGSSMVGNAIVLNGALQLSTNSGNNSSAFHIPARVGSSSGFTIKFDYTVIENTGNPADGFAISYGALPFGSLSTLAEEGFPGSTCLSFEMDTYENGGPEIGPSIGVNDVTVAANPSPILNPNSTITGTICIVVLPDGTSSFTSTGALTNADFEGVQTGFELLDTHTFAFGARTGGASEEVLIDNIEIVAGLPDSDGDGLFDFFEIENGLDPLSAVGDDGATGDPDGDGLNNLAEQDAGSDPNDDDTDDDGLLDAVEDGGGTWASPSMTGTSPTNPDSDGDLLSDGVEDNGGTFVGPMQTGTDPNNPNTDGDNADDGAELVIGRDPTIPDDPGPSNRYVQDFDVFPDGFSDLADGSTIGSTSTSAAQVVGQQLRLTQDGEGSTRSSFRIPALLGSSQGWTATFDFTLIDGPGANNPADGFNFSYGAIPAYDPLGAATGPSGHGAAEESWPGVDHLAFEIDTWDGASDWGVNIASEIGGIGTDHSFTMGQLFADGQTVSGTATMSWNPTDGASFTTTGLLVNADFENIEIPGFNPNDDYIFAFGTRTGGANETLLIDNINIQTGAEPLKLDVEGAGDNLVLTWDSAAGKVYDVVTSLDLTTPISSWLAYELTPGDPATALVNLPTDPPENTATFLRPAEDKRFFAVIERKAPAFFSDDFETDKGWTVVDNAPVGKGEIPTVWERGVPAVSPVYDFGPFTGANDSANCFGTNLGGDYADGADISLISPDLDLTDPGIAGATLSFFQWIDTDFFDPLPGEMPMNDFLVVRVLRASDNVQLGADVTGPIGGLAANWAKATFPLPPEAAGEIIKLEFRFVSDANFVFFAGFYLDDVELDLE